MQIKEFRAQLFRILKGEYASWLVLTVFLITFILAKGLFFQLVLLILGLILGNLFASKEAARWMQSLANPLIRDLQTNVYSLVFMALMIPVSLLVVTSTGSMLGIGLVFSLTVQIALTLFKLKDDHQAITTKFFVQLKRTPTFQETQFVVWFWTGWTAVLWLMLLLR